MTIAVGPLLDSVSVTLLDTARRSWPLQSDLVPYLNEALAATAAIKPDMYTRQEFFAPEPGVSQVIPDDGVALLNVIYNQASGRVITQVDGGLLDEANRFWPGATPELDVQHFAIDPTGDMHVMKLRALVRDLAKSADAAAAAAAAKGVPADTDLN